MKRPGGPEPFPSNSPETAQFMSNTLFIGGGNMASALIGGLIARGFRPAVTRLS